jgi:hypothetical protein
VYAHWPVEAFEMSGEISSYDGRGFCPRCGSRLVDTTDPGDTLIEVRVGSLDEAPFELMPEDEIWVKRRECWIPPVEGATQHDESAHHVTESGNVAPGTGGFVAEVEHAAEDKET